MANWWNQIGTGLGDALAGINNPFGMAPPQGYDRNAAIRQGALQLGTNMLANPYATPMEAIGKGYQQAQAQAGENQIRRMQAESLLFDMDERKRKKAREEENRLFVERAIKGMTPEEQALAQAYPEEWAKRKFLQMFPDAPTPTDDLREYEAAVRQGYKGSFLDYKKELGTFAPPKPPSYDTITTEEGVFRVSDTDPNVMVKVGDPPPTKPTDDLSEYAAAVKQGYKGSFVDYKKELNKAGAPTIDMEGETAYAIERGKAFAKAASDIDEGERSAFKTINSLNQMENLVKDPSFYSGFGAPQLNALKKAAVALGADPNTITSTEQFNTLSKQSALDTMGGSLGTGFSNADRDFVIEQVPNIGNTPAGNLAIIKINRKMQERKIEIARMARAYEKKNGKIDAAFLDELSEWAEGNPLFGDIDISTSGPNKTNPSPVVPRRKYNPNTGKIE